MKSAAKTFTITTPETGPFSVGVGDKVVVVTKSRWHTNDDTPPYRSVCTVSAVRGGKQPRIELTGSGQSFDAAGHSNWRSGDSIEPYDAEKEARFAKEAENATLASQMATRLSIVSQPRWRKICLNPVARELLQGLIKEAEDAG